MLQDIEEIVESSTKSVRGAHTERQEVMFSLKKLDAQLFSTSKEIYIIPNLRLNSFREKPTIIPDFSTSTPYLEHTRRFMVRTTVLDKDSGAVLKLEGDCPVSVLPAQQGNVSE